MCEAVDNPMIDGREEAAPNECEQQCSVRDELVELQVAVEARATKRDKLDDIVCDLQSQAERWNRTIEELNTLVQELRG